MAGRDPHPMRRAAREEARVWPAAIVIVALYLVAAHLIEPATDTADAPAWQIKDGEQ